MVFECMSDQPAGNPYAPPSSEPLPVPAKESMAATRVMGVTVWIFWVLLILSYPLDLFVAVFQPRKEEGRPDATFASI